MQKQELPKLGEVQRTFGKKFKKKKEKANILPLET